MCGIICLVTTESKIPDQVPTIERNVRNRGPDYFGVKRISFGSKWNGYFAASVLHTQGTQIFEQPASNSDNDILLWNGDVFGGVLVSEKSNCISDTQVLAEWLRDNDGDVLKMVTMIEGPYCFVYFNRKQRRLWLSRDPLGRHSLLWQIERESLLITSVGCKDVSNLNEIPAIGLFCFHLDGDALTDVHLYRWSHAEEYLPPSEQHLPTNLVINDDVVNFFNLRESLHYLDESEPEFFCSASTSTNILEIMDSLLIKPEIGKCVDEFINLLIDSCRKRVTIRRNKCKNCMNEVECSNKHAKLGVLFSGGLDSTVIARIADKFVPEEEPIDLMNVAFNRNGSFLVPDRKTAFMSLEELRTLCPERVWNLVEINVTDEELANARRDHIAHLIHPLGTVLDESLGCALWFACTGRGAIDGLPYTSSAKILMLGNGADEQLGGYMRHRNMLRRCGWKELGTQLLKETVEISRRNLGRDDRIACDSGRQPRFPFLDDVLVKYVAELPSWQKCGPPSFPPGLGDKLILRLSAVKLGLRQCCTFPKRAFQFGCRIAKSKEKGDAASERL